MKEHGLIFKGELIPALLDGSKKLTRRLPRSQPKRMDGGSWYWKHKSLDAGYCHTSKSRMMSFMLEHSEYQIGDRIWVRETFKVLSAMAAYETQTESGMDFDEGAATVQYMDGVRFAFNDLGINDKGVDESEQAVRFSKKHGNSPSIHMPRWASRIILEITDVRVERVQDISEEDALCEIARTPLDKRYVVQDEFIPLWNSLYGNWDENPWVYVIEFKKIGE